MQVGAHRAFGVIVAAGGCSRKGTTATCNGCCWKIAAMCQVLLRDELGPTVKVRVLTSSNAGRERLGGTAS